MKKPYPEIKNAILAFDETYLSSENVNTLLQVVPTPEEVELVTSFQGDKNLFAEPEKFVEQVNIFILILSLGLTFNLFK